MITNFLKVAFRNLVRHKGFSLINIIGLAFSLSLCLLILLFIQDQRDYDRFHQKADRIYRVTTRFEGGFGLATTPFQLGAYFRESYPEVEEVVRLKPFSGVVSWNQTNIPLRGFYAGEQFFDLFSFDLLSGNPAYALSTPYSIVLSQEAAERFFGGGEAMGRELVLEHEGIFTVTGVLAPVPDRTSLQFDALISFTTSQDGPVSKAWSDSPFDFYSYLLLKEGERADDLEQKFPELIERQYGSDRESQVGAFQLQPITNIRLGPTLSGQHGFTLPPVVLYAAGFLAFVVMVTACINYVSLSVARALKRAKEVGVRKVVGARRRHITGQFVIESVLISLTAFIPAFVLLFLLVPAFNRLWIIQFTGSQITVDFAGDMTVVLTFLLFTILVGVLAGIYPAFFLSSFRPIQVVKGLPALGGASRLTMRKILIVSQFALALLLITTTILLYRQARVLLVGDYGFNTEQVINLELQDAPYEPLKSALEQNPGILKVSASSSLPGTGEVKTSPAWRSHPDEKLTILSQYAVDYGFLDNMTVNLVAGRNFSPEFSTDSVQSAILNEKAVQALGFESARDALGQTFTTGYADNLEEARNYQVVGVVQDFHFNRLESPIEPMMLHYRPDLFRYASVRIIPGEPGGVLEYVESTWKQFDRFHPLRMQFYDERLDEQYVMYDDAIGVLGLASFMAVLIALLGLFGMSTYLVEARTKEVGVRKALGAGVPGLVLLLSREFLKLVVISAAIAVPLSWLLNSLWLQFFATRASLDIWVFGPAIFGLLGLTILTISSQTIRAAMTNPVDTLRYE